MGVPSPFRAYTLTATHLSAGARGQYVDVLGGANKPLPAAPGNLFTVLPKSASMPANIFVPNALGKQFHSID